MKRRNKIKKTKENREYYLDLIEKLCHLHNYDFLEISYDIWREKSYYIKSHNYWINIYNEKGEIIYTTNTYGNYLNAYGEVIRYLERIK